MTDNPSPRETFLADMDRRPFAVTDGEGLEPVGLALGQGRGALEVAIARAAHRPTQALMRAAWKARHGGRAVPLVLVVLHADRAAICGPGGDDPPVYLDLDRGMVERLCRTALAEPDRHAASRFLRAAIPEVESPLGDRKKAKKRLRAERPDLVAAVNREVEEAAKMRELLIHGPFPGMGIGDPDLYKAFCWRFWALIRADRGRLGVVLPRSAFSVKGSAPFRETLLARASADFTFLANNAHWVFPEVDPRYTIALSCLVKVPSERRVALRGPYRSMERFQSGVASPPADFAADEVLKWTDTAAFPLLPSEESATVFGVLRKAPRLDEDVAGSWRARGLSEEIHSRKEQHLMRSGRPHDGDWPVYKGESFDLWNPDTGTYYGWADPEKTAEYLNSKRWNGSRRANSPFWEFADRPGFLRDPNTLPCTTPRIAIRRVTNRTNQRTLLAALIPGHTFLADQASCLLWPRGDEKDVAYVLGVLSSIPLDWYARRFVETDVRMHIINPLPIPRRSRRDKLWRRTVELAARLAAADARFAEWAEAVGVEFGPLEVDEKNAMIHELDAVVAHLYGLSERQLVHIFETFHEGWDYHRRLEAVLRHYHEWADRL